MYVLLYCGVCTGARLLPPGENPIAVINNNNNNNNNNLWTLRNSVGGRGLHWYGYVRIGHMKEAEQVEQQC
jgi:hypothetical protein